MSAASSNTRVTPVIRPHPPCKLVTQIPPPPPYRGSIRKYSIAKKHIGLAAREILVPEACINSFEKPSVHGFPTADRADRRCRFHPAWLAPNRATPGTYGYRATSAHHQQVGVRADGHARTPPPGPPPLRRRRAPPIGTQLSISCLRQCAKGYRNGSLLKKEAP
jgi:hypothetical protein